VVKLANLTIDGRVATAP